MTVFFSYFPIILLIFLMTKKKAMPSFKALPFIALITYGIMLIIFQHSPQLIHANVLNGLLTAWTPIMILTGAIFLFRTMEESGGMDILRRWLNSVTPNKVAQLMIVGWAFPFLIEGASGFGTPAALAAPILVGLGFPTLKVAVMALVMNSVPVSFGAVGTPTWFGFSGLDLSSAEILQIGIKSAFINSAASLIIPILAMMFVVSFDEIKKNIIFVYLSIISTMVPYILIAFFNYEFPSLVGGGVGLILSVIFAKMKWGLASEEESLSKKTNNINSAQLIKASFPLWGTILLLIITRIPQLGIKGLLNASEPSFTIELGYLGSFSISPMLVVSLKGILGTQTDWTHKILYVPSLIPFVLISIVTFKIFQMPNDSICTVWQKTISQMKSPMIALFGALIFVKLMMMGDNQSAVALIGKNLADITGDSWKYMAAPLGAVGSFFSGSNTVSNLTFGGIQDSIARDLGLNRTTILALQSVGGAMGNMVCINNIVAVCSVLAITQKEGTILLQTTRTLIIYTLIAALMAMIL